MKASELRGLSIEDLQARLDDARENYFKLRFQFATGQLTDHSQLNIARKEIARVATILRETELEAEKEQSKP